MHGMDGLLLLPTCRAARKDARYMASSSSGLLLSCWLGVLVRGWSVCGGWGDEQEEGCQVSCSLESGG